MIMVSTNKSYFFITKHMKKRYVAMHKYLFINYIPIPIKRPNIV